MSFASALTSAAHSASFLALGPGAHGWWGSASGVVAGAAAVVALVGIVAGVLARVVRRRGGSERIDPFTAALLAHPSRCMITTKPDGTIAALTLAAERLLGVEAAQVVGRVALSAYVAPENSSDESKADGEKVAESDAFATMKEAASAAGAAERSMIWRHASGTPVPVVVSLSAIRDTRGTISGYLVLVDPETARRAAEERVHALEQQLAHITTQVPGMVFQFRQPVEGKRCFPYVSDGIREIFRIEPAEVAHDAGPVLDRIHPEDVDMVTDSLKESAATLGRWQCEFRTRLPDETIRWVSASAQPQREPDGAILWQGFISDTTERKLSDRAHEESRALLQSVFTSVDLGVFVVDVTGGGDFRFVEVNPAYERLTGIGAAEIRGRTPRDLVPLIPAEMAECLRTSFRRGTESTGPIEYEEPFFVHGRLLWWLTRLTPLRDSVGNVVRLVGRSLDITERKTIELRFQSLTERLQLATEAAQVGIWDHDLVQNRLVWDNRMHVLCGTSPNTFDNSYRSFRQLVHPADVERLERESREARESNKPFNTSYRIVRPDGEERELRACAHVQRNPAGRAVRMVGVNWDVTAERRSQAEIVRARDEAERLNAQLEDALARANQLAQEAAAATVAKSEFLANMSHEIRTPLNAVIGMSGLLLGTDLSKDQREFAETIRTSGDGLLGLLNDILDYSKIESGRLDLEHRPFDLRECVESALDVLAGRAAEKNIDLLSAIDPTVPESITGDDTRLRQVLVNLLSNAVKFTSSGEVFLSVTAVEEQGMRLRFAVHDSGIGIPTERMDRLFKTFSQVDASTTRQFGGTGLGLAICKRIVELMGGRIWVESRQGRGSVFFFEIPAPAGTSLRPFAATKSPLLTGRRVLVVDDNATSCRVLCQQFVAWGMMPRAVSSGAEALQVLARERAFDLALIDVEMPEMTGPELVAAIRRDHAAMKLPIAMLTRRGRGVAEELGVAGLVSKPVKAASLYELCVELFQGRQVVRTVAALETAMLGEEHPLAILVAEDNPVNQRVAILMLQRLGYRADVAANGREVIEAVQRQRYDLVLMDVQMPEMDGLQAAREICAMLTPDVRPRIVAMTANASTSDRDECFAAGMEDFLTKPVRNADLRRAIVSTPGRHALASSAA